MKATVALGPEGVQQALQQKQLIVIVDVLRFSSTVTTAVANGFEIIPASTPMRAETLSKETGIPFPSMNGTHPYTLSPLDYLNPKHPETVILVSPNGAACTELIKDNQTAFFGCFLNARTVGRVVGSLAARMQKNVAVIAAGEAQEEQFSDLHHRRFAVEDYLGCGSTLCELRVDLTPEALVCKRAYDSLSLTSRS